MKKILIVEDHADTRKLIRMTLELEDFEIFEAATGDEGLALTSKARPDIVLLDVAMPSAHNNLEVCRRIKQAPLLQHTRVVRLPPCGSGGGAEDVAQARRHGADDALPTPFSTQRILDSIRQLEARA